MNQKRYMLSWAAATIVLLVTGWLWHVGMFSESYAVWLKPVEKLKKSAMLVIIAEICRGGTLAYIYPLVFRGGKPWSEGIRFGLMMGFFTGLVIAIIYAQVNFKSISWLFAEFAFVLLQGMIVGTVIAYLFGKHVEQLPE